MDWQQQWQYLIEQLYVDFIIFFEPDWEDTIDFSRPPTFLNLPESVTQRTTTTGQQNLLIGIRQKNDTPSLMLFVIETKGYDNQMFTHQVFHDFITTLSEFHYKIPLQLFTLFLANSIPKDAERYEYKVGSTQLQLQFKHYIVREQYLEDLLDMVNPFAFAIAACRLRLEYERTPKLKLEQKLLLIKKLLQRYLKNRINLEALLTIFRFVKVVVELPDDWEGEFKALARIEIQLHDNLKDQDKQLLIDALA
jgi:hypothetical protein